MDLLKGLIFPDKYLWAGTFDSEVACRSVLIRGFLDQAVYEEVGKCLRE